MQIKKLISILVVALFLLFFTILAYSKSIQIPTAIINQFFDESRRKAIDYIPNSEITTTYQQDIGERVVATAIALSLSKQGWLFICYGGNDLKHKMLSDTSKCSVSKILNYKKNNIAECYEYCYAGWVTKEGQNAKAFKNKWFSYISKYPEIGKIMVMIDKKFINIFHRLYINQKNKKEFKEQFFEYKSSDINYSSYLTEFDRDIKLLSLHGIKLANVTKRLMNAIKPAIINAEMQMEIMSDRSKSQENLRSFGIEINRINKLSKIGVYNLKISIITLLDSAIDDLEQKIVR